MKPRLVASPLALVIASSALAAVMTPLLSSAATFTWDGGDATSNSWGTAGNWDPNTVPTFDNTADLVFNVLTRPNNFIGANRTIRSISYGADIDATFQSNLQDFSGGTSRNLTFLADAGNATITVDAGATGDITLGTAGGSGSFGNPLLGSNLDIVHNGTGLLLINRPFQAAAFSITKSGSGRMQTNNNNLLTGSLNINGGTFIANSFSSTGLDLANFTAINLGGATLQIAASTGTNKTYATGPITVSAASTLEYRNTNATTYTTSFTGTGFTLNADLLVRNISTDTTLVNGLNLSRPITGSGDITVSTYNNLAANTDTFSLGRILLAGDNSAWTGDLTVARGSISIGGTAVNAAGSGTLTIGTAADAFGAGVTFFPQGPNGSSITYTNPVTVEAGGFRAIKGGGTDHSVTFTGNVTLNGNLVLDHTWGATDRRLALNGVITGPGGITVTRASGNAGTTARLGGANTYLGATSVATGASLVVAGSLTSDITVASGARLGGDGSTSEDLTLSSGARFIFSPSATFDASGVVTVDSTFGVASLLGGSQGEAVNWTLVADGTYTLIGTTASTFDHIANFGSANALDLGGGRSAYFKNGTGGGLQLVVATAGYSAWQSANTTTQTMDLDHDGDGVSNGVEFFLGGNTNTTGFTPLPAVASTSGILSITWTKAATFTGGYNTDFVVETSSTLANPWTTAPLGTGAGNVEISGNTVKYTFPSGSGNFARLRVFTP